MTMVTTTLQYRFNSFQVLMVTTESAENASTNSEELIALAKDIQQNSEAQTDSDELVAGTTEQDL